MNNLIKSCAFIALTGALAAHSYADTILGIHAGAMQWNSDISGNLGRGDAPITAQELGFKDDSNNVLYVALEHPIPLIPNVRLSQTSLELSGSALVERSFTFDDRTFDANAQTTSQIDVSHTDVTLYYEILDNWVNLDIGLSARIFDGFAEVSSTPEGQDTITDRADLDETIPMLYARARFDLPLSGLYGGASLNYIGSGDNTISDIEAYVGYEFDLPLLDLGVRAGLRDMTLEAETDNDLNADISIDGVFVGVTLHF